MFWEYIVINGGYKFTFILLCIEFIDVTIYFHLEEKQRLEINNLLEIIFNFTL